MSVEHIINAWRDEEYRESLDAELRETLPESPIGAIDLSENELLEAQGGSDVTFGPLCISFASVTLSIVISSIISTLIP